MQLSAGSIAQILCKITPFLATENLFKTQAPGKNPGRLFFLISDYWLLITDYFA